MLEIGFFLELWDILQIFLNNLHHIIYETDVEYNILAIKVFMQARILWWSEYLKKNVFAYSFISKRDWLWDHFRTLLAQIRINFFGVKLGI